MADSSLAVANIVSNPSPASWSQAYNAGKLFAVLALEKKIPGEESATEELGEVGKEVLSTLEQEFFTLETKDLDSIKGSLSTTVQKIPPEVTPSFVICYIAGSVLYVFIYGKGKVTLKRGSKIGDILEGDEESSIKSASGFLQKEDLIILQTEKFSNIIPRSTLVSSFDHLPPQEIAESIAPHIHEREEGGASAVIVGFNEEKMIPDDLENTAIPSDNFPQVSEDLGEKNPTPEMQNLQDESVDELAEKETSEPEAVTPLTEPEDELDENGDNSQIFLEDSYKNQKGGIPIIGSIGGVFRKINIRRINLNRSRRLYATIAGLIIIVILGSLLLKVFNSGQNDQALFQKIYGEAKSKYDEGENLKGLNDNLAKDSFTQAKTILDANKNKFKQGSTDDKQIEDLLSKVNSELSGSTSQTTETSAKEVDSSKSPLLSYEINNSASKYFTENTDNVYFLDGSGASLIDKGNDKKTKIISKSWTTDGGIGVFGSNVYVLDRSDGILKFVPAASSSAYTKLDYFSGSVPDLATSVDMAIDGSVYILFKDGSVQKYTRGAKDTFSISGVSLSEGDKIFTNSDASSVYILDKKNSRIVSLDKSGKFKKTYSAGVLKGAKDFVVDEANKSIFVLSGSKVYQISL